MRCFRKFHAKNTQYHIRVVQRVSYRELRFYYSKLEYINLISEDYENQREICMNFEFFKVVQSRNLSLRIGDCSAASVSTMLSA